MFIEILHRVIFMEIVLFIFLIINALLFAFTQNPRCLMSIIFICFGIAFGIAYLIIQYHIW